MTMCDYCGCEEERDSDVDPPLHLDEVIIIVPKEEEEPVFPCENWDGVYVP
jgi:hypothetical protein